MNLFKTYTGFDTEVLKTGTIVKMFYAGVGTQTLWLVHEVRPDSIKLIDYTGNIKELLPAQFLSIEGRKPSYSFEILDIK